MVSSDIRVEEVVPAASRTISSLRDIGYELPQAVADLVDNSIEADATEVHVDLGFMGEDSWIRISDNGIGMDTRAITESLRIGAARDYADDDLGKFGFGLKTASISQCRRLVVASRTEPDRVAIDARAFDLDHIERTNRWEILILGSDARPDHLTGPLHDGPGTVVLWENLDRILTYRDPEGYWAKQRLLADADDIYEHLAMVFHRFLSGSARGRQKVEIYVNGAHVEPWDPFCSDEPATDSLDQSHYQVASGGRQGIVSVHPYVLPGKDEFSDAAAWNRASGPNKWNNQQGLYVYRADRLIQWGGWSRLRTLDEHLKLARVALDFTPDLDSAFGINISKAIVTIPSELKKDIQPEVTRVCSLANEKYRNSGRTRRRPSPPRPATPPSPTTPTSDSPDPGPRSGGYGLPPLDPPQSIPPVRPAGSHQPAAGLFPVNDESNQTGLGGITEGVRAAFERAAGEIGEREALERIVANLRRMSPEVAHDLGW